MQYVKLEDNTIIYPPKNKGSICNYDINVELLIQDGYKEFIEAERPLTNRIFHIEYAETENTISEVIVYDETQEQADARELRTAKDEKIRINDTVRDSVLAEGVEYQDILFDSDTDQKVNLLATVSMMSNTDTIEWFGMNNDSLVCTKQDLLNIGELITGLHTHCWTKNAEIKTAINEATTIEEVDEIEVNYED